MAQANTTTSDNEDIAYFRSKVFGLSVVIGDPDPTKGEVAPKTVQFVPYWEEARGVEGRFKVGYLKTRSGSAIKKLENDPTVQRISKQQFEDATVVAVDDAGAQISGLRAPL